MKFSYNAVWDRTLALLGTHAPLVGAIAGVFIFLPSLLLGHFFPVPQGVATDPQAEVQIFTDYMAGTWHWQLAAGIATMVGTLAILILVLDNTHPTVGAAIAGAFRALPYFLLAAFIVGAAMLLAAILILLPFSILAATGLQAVVFLGVIAAFILLAYFSGRMAVIAPVASIERRTPLDMIRRTLELTRGRAWAIFALVLLILLAGGIASLALTFVVGGLFQLLLDADLARFLILLVSTAFNAALNAFLVLTLASIYRELSSTDPIPIPDQLI